MIITSITGGLGNQLFQYAMARRLAVHHGTELLVDTMSYGENGECRPEPLKDFIRPLALFRFNVNARAATVTEICKLKDDFTTSSSRDRLVRVIRRFVPGFLCKTSHIIEHQYRFQPEALDYPDNVYLQGFWQSPKYFDDIADVIHAEFTLVDGGVAESSSLHINHLRKKYGTVVSLHVRRGDLAHAQETLKQRSLTHAAPITKEYIKKAMERFSPEVCFMVFSDSPKDIQWCRENIHSKNVEFSSAESDLWDFSAMTACDHHIIANSSFSWWAAWLDDKPEARIIAPSNWALANPKHPITTDDLIPDRWELV